MTPKIFIMMIESRYKIEYIFPDEKNKKASSLKTFLLVPLLSLSVLGLLAVSKSYSLDDLSKDSLAFIENTKDNIFQFGSNSFSDKKTPDTLQNSQPIDNKSLELISELEQKEKNQLKNIQDEITKNTKLSEDLNKISEQLILEKKKNEKLNILLSQQKFDKEQLEERLTDSLLSVKKSAQINKPLLTKTSSNNSLTKDNGALTSTQTTKIETMYATASSSNKPVKFVADTATIEAVTPVKQPIANIKTNNSPKAVAKSIKTKTVVAKAKEIKPESKPTSTKSSAVDDIIATMNGTSSK